SCRPANNVGGSLDMANNGDAGTSADAAPTTDAAVVPFACANQHYVAPTGSASGDGTLGNPWDLQTALNQPASVQPGDCIWLRGGTYSASGFFNKLTGTASAPIIVRQYPG